VSVYREDLLLETLQQLQNNGMVLMTMGFHGYAKVLWIRSLLVMELFDKTCLHNSYGHNALSLHKETLLLHHRTSSILPLKPTLFNHLPSLSSVSIPHTHRIAKAKKETTTAAAMTYSTCYDTRSYGSGLLNVLSYFVSFVNFSGLGDPFLLRFFSRKRGSQRRTVWYRVWRSLGPVYYFVLSRAFSP